VPASAHGDREVGLAPRGLDRVAKVVTGAAAAVAALQVLQLQALLDPGAVQQDHALTTILSLLTGGGRPRAARPTEASSADARASGAYGSVSAQAKGRCSSRSGDEHL